MNDTNNNLLQLTGKLVQNGRNICKIAPDKRPYKDHLSTLFKYNMMFEQQKEKRKSDQCLIRQSVSTTKPHSSLRDLNELKPINLKDMQVNKIHYGFYIECKTIVDPFYISGMMVLIEDSQGDIETLSIYNYKSKSYDIDPSELLPKGTRLRIKEPFLKLYACGNGEFGIRIDSPTDIQVLPNEDSNKSIEKLIDEGNKFFQRLKIHPALSLYSQAVHASSDKSVRALLNRSAAYLKLDKYYLACKDAQLAAELDKTNEKAFYRMGKSFYLMRQFEKAKENFEICLKLDQNNKEVKIELEKTNKRIHESQTGLYDFESILEQVFTKNSHDIDVADYKSPKISIADVPKKSKGVIASKFLNRGELLVVSKAISATFREKEKKNFSTKIDLTKNRYDLNDGAQNFTNTVYKMESDPYLAKQVYLLYAGPDYKRDEEKTNEFIIDISRIGGIQKFNSFRIEDISQISKIVQEESMTDKESGLWLFPSFFNHSCLENGTRLFLADLLLIYANRDIKEGEEITLGYFSEKDDYEEKIKYSTNTYDFKCDCRLCKLDAADDRVKKRINLRNKLFVKSSKLVQMSINEVLEDVEKMRKTYENRAELQCQMIYPLQFLAKKYELTSDYLRAAKTFEEVYLISKEFDNYKAFIALKMAYNNYKSSAQHEKCKWCLETASGYYNDNLPFFQRIWKQF